MKNHKVSVKNILIIIILISITFNILLLGEIIKTKTESKAVINEYTKKQQELDEKSKANDKELEKIFDKYYSDKLKRIMDKDDIMFLAQRQWNYALTMNGKDIVQNTIYSEDKNIKIVLAEFQNSEKILPEDILLKGSVTGGDPNDSLASQLDIITLRDYKVNEEEQENGKRISYEFNNISSGTMITLKLSEMLMNRLNLKDNKLEIIVR